jgi:hypothetical protein
MLLAEIRRHRAPRIGKAFPLADIGQRWQRDVLASVEADKRDINQLGHVHDARYGVHVAPRPRPNLRAGGGRQRALPP